ncbi:MAG TPA: hypothetical protein VGI73_13555 [Solirubrobacterales bacterium]|jgi:hypothetical protein
MDAVKEAVLEQKIDNLTVRVDGLTSAVNRRFEQVDARFEQIETRFDRAEDRNQAEHGEIRGEIEVLRVEMNEGFRSIQEALHDYNRNLVVTLGSVIAVMIASLAAAATSVL